MQRHRRDWQNESQCQDEPGVLDGELDYSEVESYCAGCPVLLECRNYALVHEPYGNWGGYNRRRLNKTRKSLGELGMRDLVRSAVKNKWIEAHNLFPTMAEYYSDLLSAEQRASSLYSSSTTPRAKTRTLGEILSDLSGSLPEFSFEPLEEYSQAAL